MSKYDLLRFQIECLSLTISAAGAERWEKGATLVIDGKEVGVGGRWKPDANSPNAGIVKDVPALTENIDQIKSTAIAETFKKDAPALSENIDQATAIDQASNAIASQPKENIVAWIKDGFGENVNKILEKLSEFYKGIDSLIFKPIQSVPNLLGNTLKQLDESIRNNSQVQFVKGLLKSVSKNYNDSLENLKHLDNQPAIIQGIGKALGSAIPIITTVLAGLAPDIALAILFPPGLLTGLPELAVFVAKMISITHFGHTIAEIDKEIRGIKEENLSNPEKNLERSREYVIEFLASVALGGVTTFAELFYLATIKADPSRKVAILPFLSEIPETILKEIPWLFAWGLKL